MAVPSLTPLPSPPLPTDPEAVFDEKAGNSLAAQVTFTHDMNDKVIPAINDALAQVDEDKSAAAVSAKAAADSAASSASAGARQVELATEQAVVAGRERKGAEAARDSTEVVAAAVQSGAGFPALARHAGHSLRVKLDESGVEFSELGQEIGDVLITRRATTPAGYVRPGTVYAQAAYPELFALTGILEVNNDGANFQTIAAPLAAIPAAVACGKDGVFIVIYATSARRSADGGLTWAAIPTLVGASLTYLTADDAGNWLCCDNQAASMLRSSDNGLTWVKAANSTVGLGDATVIQGLTAGAAREFVGIAYNASNARSVIRTTDAGASWSRSASLTSAALDDSAARDRKNTWVFGGPSSASAISTDDLSTLVSGGAMYNVTAGGGVVAKSIPSGGVGVTDDILSGWVENQGISGTYVTVDPAGCVHVTAQDRYGSANSSLVLRSYDVGKTWAKFARTSAPYSLKTAMSSEGVWIGINASNHYRSTRLYNYDQSTQFKTQHAKAPFGMYAYIKAKKV